MSIVSPPSDPVAAPAARPWSRVVVIGVVAALAVGIGLTAGAVLLGARVAAVGGGAAYVPADAAFYVELRLQPSTTQDAALRDLLGRFPAINGLDLDRPLGEQLVEQLDEQLAGAEHQLSWSEDIAPWTDGRLAIAVPELPAEIADPMAPPIGEAPPVLIMLGVTDPDAARASVGRIIDESGQPTPQASEHRGVTVHAGQDFAYAVTDDQLLLAQTAAEVMAALDVDASGEALAERAELAAHIDRLPDDWLAFGTFDTTSVVRAALDAAAESGDALADAMARLVELQSTVGAFTVSATADGLAFDGAAEPPTGPFAMTNEERPFAAEVPGDALYFTEGGNLGAVMTEIVTALEEAAASDPTVADELGTFESALGAELEELVSWVGDGAIAIGFDRSEPYAGFLLEALDPDAAERRLDQLATFARLAAGDPTSGIEISESEVAGVTVTTIRVMDTSMEEMGEMMPPMGVAGLSLQYAIDGDRVVVGLGERFVGRVLELEPADALAAEPRYADAVASLGGPSTAGTTWVDLAGTVELVEEFLSGFGGMMLGVDADTRAIIDWLTPLDRWVTVARVEGDSIVQHQVLLLR